jgi:WD40 repeat protein
MCIVAIAIFARAGDPEQFNIGKAPAAVTAIAFSDDAHYFLAGLENGKIIVFNLETRAFCYWVDIEKPVNVVAFAGDSFLFSPGNFNNQVGRFKLSTMERLPLRIDVTGTITSISLSPGGKALLVGTSFGGIHEFHGAKFDGGGLVNHAHKGAIDGLFWSDDGDRFLSVGEKGVWRRWQMLPKKRWIRPMKNPPEPLGELADGLIDISPDRKVLAVVTPGKERPLLRLYDFESRKQLEPRVSFDCARAGVNAVRFSPDGRTVATAGRDGFLYFVDISPQLRAAKYAIPDGPNALMKPAPDHHWPTLSKKISGAQTLMGQEHGYSAIHLHMPTDEYIKVAIRRMENGRVTEEGHDGIYGPGEDHEIDLPPGRYKFYWRKLLEGGILHEVRKPVEVIFRHFENDRGDLMVEWCLVVVTLDGDDAVVEYGENSKVKPKLR